MKLHALMYAEQFIAQSEPQHSTTLFLVSAVVWIGIVCYFVYLHIKVKNIETRIHDKK